jgi:hypothetical protein
MVRNCKLLKFPIDGELNIIGKVNQANKDEIRFLKGRKRRGGLSAMKTFRKAQY